MHSLSRSSGHSGSAHEIQLRCSLAESFIMKEVPFTISHAAAALPFRRTRLIMSALVIGCMAPDFEYFIPFERHSAYGHTLQGVFLFDLPAGVIMLWLFHRFAKEPLAACLPKGSRERLHLGPRALPAKSISQFALLVLSILVGVATHLLWDSVTHNDYWPTKQWHLLLRSVNLPLFGPRPVYGMLQYISSAAGFLIILLWFWHWYRNTEPVHAPPDRRRLTRDRIALGCAFAVALTLALLRAAEFGVPHGVGGSQRFMTKAAITGITIFCTELLIYGIVRNLGRGTVNTA